MNEGRRGLIRVFTAEVLERLRERDEPAIAIEAELEGPWEVERPPGGVGWGVYRRGEVEAGELPLCRFAERHLALLAAAVLPGLGRGRVFRVGPEATAEGYELVRDGVVVGSARFFLSDLAGALEAVEAVARSAVALALVLEASGATVLEQVGRELALRLAEATTVEAGTG